LTEFLIYDVIFSPRSNFRVLFVLLEADICSSR